MKELNWVHTAIVLLMLGTTAYLVPMFKTASKLREAGWGLMLLSLICLIISMVIRSINAEYFALSNMYESLLSVSIGILAAFLVMDRWFNLKTFGFPVGVMSVITLIYTLSLPTEIHPLQPALQSYWRSIHVPIILLSYALFTLAFLSSLVYLIKEFFESRGQNPGGGKLVPAEATAGIPKADNAFAMQPDGVLDLTTELDSENIYDEITYRCVAFGFPLLTLGIILGGMWANEAWGNYWSWDPKESMSLVTLLGYGVYLHMRINGEHSARILSWVSVIGFVLMLITYFGVNMMGLGLHSYGKIG